MLRTEGAILSRGSPNRRRRISLPGRRNHSYDDAASSSVDAQPLPALCSVNKGHWVALGTPVGVAKQRQTKLPVVLRVGQPTRVATPMQIARPTPVWLPGEEDKRLLTVALKFRLRGKRTGGGGTARVEVSDDDDEDIGLSPKTPKPVSVSHRAAFRSRGAAHNVVRAAVGTQRFTPDPLEPELVHKLRATLVPNFADGSIWEEVVENLALSLSRCVPQ